MNDNGARVMVGATPSGDPVCVISYHPGDRRKQRRRAREMAEALTFLGIPAWVEVSA